MAKNILFWVFDREAPGWSDIDWNDYKKWLKSQPLAYQEGLKATQDPSMWAAALNNFMSSQPSNTPSFANSESDSVAKNPNRSQASSMTTAEPVQKHEPHTNRDSHRYPSLSEELDRELKELSKIQPPSVKIPEPIREARPMFRDPPQAPETKLKMVPGPSSGASAYLTLVQRATNEKWRAPPVDISGTPHSVVVKFRLERDALNGGVFGRSLALTNTSRSLREFIRSPDRDKIPNHNCSPPVAS